MLEADNHDLLVKMTLVVLQKILIAGEEKQANEGLPDNPYQQLVHQAGGVDKIVTLQAHDDAQIALQAVVVLAHYFPAHADAQVLLAAATLAAFYGSIRN